MIYSMLTLIHLPVNAFVVTTNRQQNYPTSVFVTSTLLYKTMEDWF